jgi:hypothetical protein
MYTHAHPPPPGCKLVTPSTYVDSADPGAEARAKDAIAAMYDNSDAVFMGFSGSQPKDVLFP